MKLKSAVDIKDDIRAMIAEIIESDAEKISDDAQFTTDLGMDSMMALEILAGIEKKYKIVIPEEQLSKFTSLNKTVEIVAKIINK